MCYIQKKFIREQNFIGLSMNKTLAYVFYKKTIKQQISVIVWKAYKNIQTRGKLSRKITKSPHTTNGQQLIEINSILQCLWTFTDAFHILRII